MSKRPSTPSFVAPRFDDPERAELMALAADGKGHTDKITKRMINVYEKEKTLAAEDPELTSTIRYVPKQPYRIELALGFDRGAIFTAEENEKAQTAGVFYETNKDTSQSDNFVTAASCVLLTKDECPKSAFNRCTLQGWFGSSCAFNEAYLRDDLIPEIDKSANIQLQVPVRAVLLEAAQLLGLFDVTFACEALIVQFQRSKVSYGDVLVAIYIVYMCKKYNIQRIGCTQVRRYIWAMARADGNPNDRNARISFRARIKYLRNMIGLGPQNKVTRFPEEGINKTKVALTALMVGGAVVGAHQAWNNGLQQKTIAQARAPTLPPPPHQPQSQWFDAPPQLQEQKQTQAQPQSQWFDAPPQPQEQQQMQVQPQSQWFDAPVGSITPTNTMGAADRILHNIPEFQTQKQAQAYFAEKIEPQLQNERTHLWSFKMPLYREVERRFWQSVKDLPVN